ncbi:PilZ domain-containing protein [Methylobacterium sp. J-068]|uniref:PilZ domain-containing protein n=1 Tax=Methylobacterium sp. J-068 TaxID=2836649 RepID=UPI00391A5C5D
MDSASHFFAHSQSEDRRQHRRLPVTVSARVLHADRLYRTEVLDLSDGGMLLAPIDALCDAEQQIIHIESAALGKIEARVVCVSKIGIHVKVELSASTYRHAVERLINITRIWTKE